MSLLSNLRDKAVESFIKNHPMVKKFGDIVNLSIDSSDGLADVDILLKGEQYPVSFCIKYTIETTDNGTEIYIGKITCERQWINELLSLALSKASLHYPLPGIAGGIAKIFF